MAVRLQGSGIYEFGSFRLDVRERSLSRNGEPIPLMPKAFDILVTLVCNSGHLVDKTELLARVWPDSFVEESNLTQNIYLLRQALGEDSRQECSIETVRGRGYRFIGPVTEVRLPVPPAQDEENQLSTLPQVIQPRPVEPPRFSLIGHRHRATIAAAFLGVIALGLTLYFLRAKNDSVPPKMKAKSIAVLPFKALGSESYDEMLGLGMADATIVKLSKLQQIPVLPTSTVFKYTGREGDPLATGRELGVDAVLDGTIQHAGDRIRVTAQLLSVADGKLIWSDKFDEKFSNILAVQDSISERMAIALALEITGDEKKLLRKRYTDSTEAYEDYVRGLYFWNKRTEEGIRLSIKYFGDAVEKDSGFALAQALLADSYVLVGYYEFAIMPQREAYQRGRAAAIKALEMDDTLAEAHIALAAIKQFQDEDFEGAEASYRRALALSPDSATAHLRYSQLLLARGRVDEALAEIKMAQQLDPLSVAINNNLGYTLYLHRDYNKAEQYCQKAHETEPAAVQPLINLGMIYEQKGMIEEAVSVLNKARPLVANEAAQSDLLQALGHVYAVAGKKGEARKVIQELSELAKVEENAQFYRALVHTGLGEMDEAFQLLEEDSKSWSTTPTTLILDPRLDQLRSDPRYAELFKPAGPVSALRANEYQ
jgi:TolB-like protein/DNA-binding winged helix-turn-helix (wHTH) protein/Flp pilus assembly protein TadD